MHGHSRVIGYHPVILRPVSALESACLGLYIYRTPHIRPSDRQPLERPFRVERRPLTPKRGFPVQSNFLRSFRTQIRGRNRPASKSRNLGRLFTRRPRKPSRNGGAHPQTAWNESARPQIRPKTERIANGNVAGTQMFRAQRPKR